MLNRKNETTINTNRNKKDSISDLTLSGNTRM